MQLSNRARGMFKSAQIEAVVLNPDGSVKRRLGVVSTWHANPIIRLWRNLRLRLNRS